MKKANFPTELLDFAYFVKKEWKKKMEWIEWNNYLLLD